MKNLKLFTIPLLGAAFLVACGPKPMDVKDFKKKVEENYKADVINSYIGKTLHVTGDTATTKEETFKVTKLFPVDEEHPYLTFYYEGGSEGHCLYIFASDILSTDYVDFIIKETEIAKEDGIDYNLNCFVTEDSYTIESDGKSQEVEFYTKTIYNKDLVISHLETKQTVAGKTEEKKFDYNYK